MIKFFKIQLKAGALQYAIFIAVTVALLITALISTTYLHQKLAIKSKYYLKSIADTNQAFDLLSSYNLLYNTPFNTQIDTTKISITKTQWGVFDYVTINTKLGKESFKKSALVGSSSMNTPALYLQDMNKPLVVVGETMIKGKSFLPSAGVKRGNMGRYSYYGKSLIYGATAISRSQLPKLSNRDYLLGFQKNRIIPNAYYIDLHKKDTWINSFNDSLLVYHSKFVVDLNFKKLTGKILVQSDTLIRVHPTTKLKDVILVAPYIEVYDGVRGGFQTIATKNINIGQNVTLDYPSVLLLVQNENNQTNDNQTNIQKITIADNSLVKGMLIFLAEKEERNNHKAQIQINTSSQIIGEVYCEGNLELKGSVLGTVYTHSFVAKEFGSVYQNHIYNGVIDRSVLPDKYVGLLFADRKQKVIQWGY